MDKLGHEHNTNAEPFQDPLCSPLDHEELFSGHTEDEVAELWKVRVFWETVGIANSSIK